MLTVIIAAILMINFLWPPFLIPPFLLPQQLQQPRMIVQAATISCTYGTTESDSAESCRDIIRQNPACYHMSGYYWIDSCNSSEPGPFQVYCDMDYMAYDGGWIRLAEKDFTQNDSCPGEFEQITVNETTFCTTPDGTAIVKWVIPTHNCSFNEAHGYILGNQRGETNNFHIDGNNNDIDGAFVDGVTFSLLTPNSSRVHLFTYSFGMPKSVADLQACRCSQGHVMAPDLVQYDYRCDTGYSFLSSNLTNIAPRTLFTGEDCEQGDPPDVPIYTESSCCNIAGLPWFYRDLTTDWNTDIEMRIIEGNASHANSLVLLREMALYVR